MTILACFGYFIFALTIAMFCSIAITTFNLGIGPTSSSLKAIEAMIQIHPPQQNDTIIDLGSGFGRLLFTLAGRYPNCHCIGIEQSMIPYLFLLLRQRLSSHNNVVIFRSLIENCSIDHVDIAYCYLYPRAMETIISKIFITMKSKSVLISNSFALSTEKATQTIQLNDFYQTSIYLYVKK